MEKVTRRTKIVATLGPASAERIPELIEAGVDVFRLNFSHGTPEFHKQCVRIIREAAGGSGRAVGILQDLQGPKIRIGDLERNEPVSLEANRTVRITTDPATGTAERLSTTYAHLPQDVRPGDDILLDDGRIQLVAQSVEGNEVVSKVVVGGLLRPHKGINLPRTPLSAPSLTEKDYEDLRLGMEAGVDFVGLSFVRRASDIEAVREEARQCNTEGNVFVIAKIERVEAVENLDEIVHAADGIMVARGDLGVETSAAEVPLLQKRILNVAGRHAKVDITATQMLETMVRNPQPSRAEATDIANAVFDGTDAVMLSAETAIGDYPVQSVRMMSRILSEADAHFEEFARAGVRAPGDHANTVADAVVRAAHSAANEVEAKAVAVFTLSGRTAFMLSGLRPQRPMFAFTPHETTYRRLALAWGVRPILTEMLHEPGEMIALLNRAAIDGGFLSVGDRVVLVAGTQMNVGSTNIVRVHEIESP